MNYPGPDGFGRAETAALLRPLVESPALAGLDLACLDPSLDPKGESAARLVGLLEGVLAGAWCR